VTNLHESRVYLRFICGQIGPDLLAQFRVDGERKAPLSGEPVQKPQMNAGLSTVGVPARLFNHAVLCPPQLNRSHSACICVYLRLERS
jgi:hypothetical protein